MSSYLSIHPNHLFVSFASFLGVEQASDVCLIIQLQFSLNNFSILHINSCQVVIWQIMANYLCAAFVIDLDIRVEGYTKFSQAAKCLAYIYLCIRNIVKRLQSQFFRIQAQTS